ncbi:hypothetical protein BJX63DRAFT_94878 [Aspergillus granulosus]|uniref:Secreted protein n=1 Tax=Aspergillus granulosus TaxID=176169 RepID=A0ABR4HQT4_9EURO
MGSEGRNHRQGILNDNALVLLVSFFFFIRCALAFVPCHLPSYQAQVRGRRGRSTLAQTARILQTIHDCPGRRGIIASPSFRELKEPSPSDSSPWKKHRSIFALPAHVIAGNCISSRKTVYREHVFDDPTRPEGLVQHA